MKKENFIMLLMGVVGGLMFALGMCMCLLSEWDAFVPGLALGAIGAAVLIAMVIVHRRMQGKPPIVVDPRTLGIVAYGIIGALILGAGMCMTMVWEGLIAWGIIVGIVGIIMLICLIPICKGLK